LPYLKGNHRRRHPNSRAKINAILDHGHEADADTGSTRPPLQPNLRLGMRSTESRVSAPPPADSWSPRRKRRETTSTTSSDDGPEEATGYGPPWHTATRKSQWVEVKKTNGGSAGGRRRSKSKGRQSSVHKLVDLWGGKEGRTKSSGGPSKPSIGPKLVSQEPAEQTSVSASTFARHDLPSAALNSPRHRKVSTNTNGCDTGPLPSSVMKVW
jgi:AP2-associated kinase